MKLIDRKQLFYKLIYTLNLIKLDTLKIYIEIYIKIRFIQFFKFLTDTSISFDKKPNNNFCLYINY